ncbi:calcium-binding protein [Vibrio splendidus]|uniref:calcium-binding protein n=1 Tax=Vibrio splendidus TaxID=29497 RepID=UPI000C83F1D7|nr:calcium-binding protein [Vibrio splendidus]PMI48930.1 hypothetical protein BCU42_16585 [Vibrio splendidus]
MSNSNEVHNSSHTQKSQTSDNTLDTDVQADLFQRVTQDMLNSLTGSEDPDPMSIFDNMADALANEPGNEDIVQAIRELKSDPEMLREITKYQNSLNGDDDITTVGALPEAESSTSSLTIDFTGNSVADLELYSDYITGSGTTLGGFFSALPGTLGQLAESGSGAHIERLKKLDHNNQIKTRINNLSELRGQIFNHIRHSYSDYEFVVKNKYSDLSLSEAIDSRKKFKSELEELQLKQKDLFSKDAKKARKNIRLDFEEVKAARIHRSKLLNSISDVPDLENNKYANLSEQLLKEAYLEKQRLFNAEIEKVNNFEKQSNLSMKRLSKSAKRAQKLFGKVNDGISKGSSFFSLIQGGIDTAAGAGKDVDAERDEHGNLPDITEKNLRISTGVFGLAKGTLDLGTFITQKVVAKVGTEASEAVGKKVARFAPVAGAFLSVGVGVNSMLKNAKAADQALKQGNGGRAAMFSVMAALDIVTMVLDVFSGIADLIPGVGTAVSFIVDLVSTALSFISDMIGWFTEQVDTRSPETILEQDFKDFVKEGGPLETYVDNLWTSYKTQGYDLLEYYVDPEGAGLVGDEEDEDYQRKLAEAQKTEAHKAVRGAKDTVNLLRKAIIDNTYGDATREGGAADDLISVVSEDLKSSKILKGYGGNDILIGGLGGDFIYGGEGDDTLQGRDGDDLIEGGAGNDYIVGGAGVDKLYGGPGDDTIVFEPETDKVVVGGAGNDLVVSKIDEEVYISLKNEVAATSDFDKKAVAFDPAALWNKNLESSYLYPEEDVNSLAALVSNSLSNGLRKYHLGTYEISQEERDSGKTSETTLKLIEEKLADKEVWILGKAQFWGDTYVITDGIYLYRMTYYDTPDSVRFSVAKWEKTIRDTGEAIENGELKVEQNSHALNKLVADFGPTYLQTAENIIVDGSKKAYLEGDEQDNYIKLTFNQRSGAAVEQAEIVLGGGNDTFVLENNEKSSNDLSTNIVRVYGGEGTDKLRLSNVEDVHSKYYKDRGFSYVLMNKDGDANGKNLANDQVRLHADSIESVYLDSSKLKNYTDSNVQLDASLYDQDLIIDVNTKGIAKVTTTEHNDKVNILNFGEGTQFNNAGGVDTLNFSSYSQQALDIDLASRTVTGKVAPSYVVDVENHSFEDVASLDSTISDGTDGKGWDFGIADKVGKSLYSRAASTFHSSLSHGFYDYKGTKFGDGSGSFILSSDQDSFDSTARLKQTLTETFSSHFDYELKFNYSPVFDNSTWSIFGDQSRKNGFIKGYIVVDDVVIGEKTITIDGTVPASEIKATANLKDPIQYWQTFTLNVSGKELAQYEGKNITIELANHKPDGYHAKMLTTVAVDNVRFTKTRNDQTQEVELATIGQNSNFAIIATEMSGDHLKGNSDDNSLAAYGGTDTVEGRDGDDVLTAQRGKHILKGGEGSDTYKISGARVQESLLVSVSNDNDGTITVQAKNGEWANNQLVVDVLQHELGLTIDPTSLEIIDIDGNVVSNKGAISIVDNKLAFSPNNDFSSLERNRSEQIFVRFTSIGSSAELKDVSAANQIKLLSVNNVDDLKIELDEAQGKVLFKNKHGDLLFTDEGLSWDPNLAQKPDLRELAADFALRYQKMSFKDEIILGPDIYTMLLNKLNIEMSYSIEGKSKSDVTQLEQQAASATWDMYMRHSQGEGSVTGDGDDVIFADGNTVRTVATNHGDDIIYAVDGNGDLTIDTGAGNDSVAVGNLNRHVTVKFTSEQDDVDTLVVKNWVPNSIAITQSNGNYEWHIAGNKVLTLESLPDKILFEQADGKKFIVEDEEVIAYFTSRNPSSITDTQDFNFIKFLDKDGNFGLRYTDVDSKSITIKIDGDSDPNSDKSISLMAGDRVLQTFNMDLEKTLINKRNLSATGLAYGIKTLTPGGIILADKTLNANGLSDLVNAVLNKPDGREGTYKGFVEGTVLQLSETQSSDVTLIVTGFSGLGLLLMAGERQLQLFDFKDIKSRVIDIENTAQKVAESLPHGIRFKDQSLDAAGVETFITQLLSDPTKRTVLNRYKFAGTSVPAISVDESAVQWQSLYQASSDSEGVAAQGESIIETVDSQFALDKAYRVSADTLGNDEQITIALYAGDVLLKEATQGNELVVKAEDLTSAQLNAAFNQQLSIRLSNSGNGDVQVSNLSIDTRNLNTNSNYVFKRRLQIHGVDDFAALIRSGIRNLYRTTGDGTGSFLNLYENHGSVTVNGVKVTELDLTSYERLDGTILDDRIKGHAESNWIDGLGGDDLILVKQGKDNHVTGGMGNDVIKAGEGDDTFYYHKGDGNDMVEDTGGDNRLVLDNLDMDDVWLSRNTDGELLVQFGDSQNGADWQGQPDGSIRIKGDIEEIQLGDKTLNTANINLLVQAMAGHDVGDMDAVTSGGQTVAQQLETLWMPKS